MTARCLTTSNQRIDGDTETFIVADTLTSGSQHPASNMPGRRREDDTNLVTAFMSTESHSSGVNNDVSPTLKVGTSIGAPAVPAISAPSGVRRLTPVECERLQGFPDGWTAIEGAPDSRRYAAMGDAVTVPVITWIGRRLRWEFP